MIIGRGHCGGDLHFREGGKEWRRLWAEALISRCQVWRDWPREGLLEREIDMGLGQIIHALQAVDPLS